MRHLSLEPDPASLADDPAAFVLQARLIVGPADSAGEESLDLRHVAFEQVPVVVLVAAGRHLPQRRLLHSYRAACCTACRTGTAAERGRPNCPAQS